ncbi:apolipoprotein N-acyltransferase [Desulfurivibrio sp. D14AmB]|uniref:apolipoprotein N-acyltransferase n=1 Tax=Desulfurivibrio sp. D14AmB TaxID=3374370 RepID=UPI00376F436B
MSGVYRLALAAASGLLLYLSSPGSGGHGLIAWLALVPLLLATRGLASWRHCALLGLLAGLIYHLPLLRWIMVVLGEHGGVAMPVAALALVLLALYMSLYLALLTALLPLLTPWGAPPDRGRGDRLALLVMPWAVPVIWVGLDLLRSRLFTGFPWQDLAYSQYRFPLLIQAADLAGHYGISFVIVLVNTQLALLLSRTRRHQGFPLPLLPALLLPVALVLYGSWRLAQLEQDTPTTTMVSVVQSNIAQDDKWDYDHQATTVERYLELSRQALAARPELIVWPETALPFFPLEHELFQRVESFAAAQESCLLVGAPHRERDAAGITRYFNSALLLAPVKPGQETDPLAGIYHKQHLVPFGEYIPLRRLLPFFAPIVETLGDFTPGPGPTLLNCNQRRLGVLICYEAIFPRLARQMTAGGADLLINITNDAWFGPTNAPHQHLSMAVLRSVENRRSLARAANTGISALVGPDGRIRQATGLFVADQRSALLPLPAHSGQTSLFTDGGHLFAPGCLLLLIAGIIRRVYVRMIPLRYRP